jgi:hypothetical protein
MAKTTLLAGCWKTRLTAAGMLAIVAMHRVRVHSDRPSQTLTSEASWHGTQPPGMNG